MTFSKKYFYYIGAPVLLILIIFGAYLLWPKPVRVALVNMPDFVASRMAVAVDKKNVRLTAVTDLSELKNYDAMISFGMGLKWTDEDRALIKQLGEEKGLKYLAYMTTTPENNISNLDSLQREKLESYLVNGGTSNYRSGFNYIRKEVLGKSLRTGTIEEPIEYGYDLLFTDEDPDLAFDSVESFQKFYNEHGYKEGAPRIALFTGIAGPFGSSRDYLDELIGALEESGFNVYPISAMTRRLEFLTEIKPQAVIYFAHGRFGGDPAIAWLKEHNVPIFSPLIVSEEYSDWLQDKQGMWGGYLSQTVVTPEIDGAIHPFALVTLRENKQGFKEFHTIPERLPDFCSLLHRYVKLQTMSNADKRIALFYFKGPGQNSLVAQGIEVVPSLYNVLKYLQSQGYDLTGLPDTEEAFAKDLMSRGALYNNYAEGNKQLLLSSNYPAFVSTQELTQWIDDTFPPALKDSIEGHYGAIPGHDLVLERDGVEGIAVTRLTYGKVALLPQPGSGSGELDFKMVHGSTSVPAYPYIASYLWARNGWQADVLMHFGTHGSLEFIPGKQVALSNYDYTDRLVRDLPHIYYYTTANVGECMIAKRRSYGQAVSYLAPPFIDTQLDKEMQPLRDLTDRYLASEKDDDALSKRIKEMTIAKGFHRDLKLDSTMSKPYTRDEIELVASFIDELANAKIVGGMYTTGVPFSSEKIRSSVRLLSVDPIAYALAQVDKSRGRITDAQIKDDVYFNSRYLRPADHFVARVQDREIAAGEVDALLQSLGVSGAELARVDQFLRAQQEESAQSSMMGGMPAGMMGGDKAKAKPQGKPSGMPTDHPGGMPKGMPKEMGGGTSPHGKPASAETKKDPKLVLLAEGISLLRRSVAEIPYYKRMLSSSPQLELASLANALSGGYTAPSPGGDFIASPSVLPTGRNLYAIDPEMTPTAKAWEDGQQLADALIADYRSRHNDSIPRKVSFTLWSSSFIESEGTTIAEIMALLGVEPVRDRRGKVIDVRVIPIKELGRPRVDVVIQTSGQLRDIAASRLFLLQKAIDLVAETKDGKTPNQIALGRVEAERVLLEHGIPPEQARKLSGKRIFGGLNGAYGTGIQEMVESGDRWEKESEIAEVYMNNMGAIYGDEDLWGETAKGIFEAALQNTDAVVQPRQSNTWGALSLDHVYEFMGGLTLSVRHVTGKDPEGYFTDLRNRRRVKTQEIKQAISIEARTTILNPTYVREQLKEGAGAADAIDETIRNTYAWNVMKPSAIDKELWDALYDMYVVDKHQLGTVDFFEQNNPAALQDLTASMMETIRKGYWQATAEQKQTIAQLHAESLAKAGAGCSGMVCDNAKLRKMIQDQLTPEQQQGYTAALDKALKVTSQSDQKQQVLSKDSDKAQGKKQSAGSASAEDQDSLYTTEVVVIGGVVIVLILVLSILYSRRKKRTK